MPQKAWSNKRERQYEHIKESEKDQGRSTKRAKEIAARTVDKERARAGEAKESSRTSRRTSRRVAAVASARAEPAARPNQGQLYNEAKRMNIQGPRED